MAYTRGAATRGVRHMDDGEIGPAPTKVLPSPPPFQQVVPTRYALFLDAVPRSVEAWEALAIAGMIPEHGQRVDGRYAVVVSEDEHRALSPDIRRHFGGIA